MKEREKEKGEGRRKREGEGGGKDGKEEKKGEGEGINRKRTKPKIYSQKPLKPKNVHSSINFGRRELKLHKSIDLVELYPHVNFQAASAHLHSCDNSSAGKFFF